MSAAILPKPTETDRCELLLAACRYLDVQVLDLSEQAALNVDDRAEVLQKLEGLAETIRETRATYEAALPQPL